MSPNTLCHEVLEIEVYIETFIFDAGHYLIFNHLPRLLIVNKAEITHNYLIYTIMGGPCLEKVEKLKHQAALDWQI